MPTELCSIPALARERKCEFCAKQKRRYLGTPHAEIGAYLLGLWGTPNNVVEATPTTIIPPAYPIPDLTALCGRLIGPRVEKS